MVSHYVNYYQICQKHQNKIYYDKKKQRKRAVEQQKNIKNHIEDYEPPQVKLFIQRNEINVEKSNTETIIQWIYNVKEMMKKVSKLPCNDIRRFLNLKL